MEDKSFFKSIMDGLVFTVLFITVLALLPGLYDAYYALIDAGLSPLNAKFAFSGFALFGCLLFGCILWAFKRFGNNG